MERQKKKVCVVEGWEGGRENGDEDCVCLGSHGTIWQTQGSSSQRGGLAKARFCETSYFSLEDQKAKWQVCAVLTLVALDTSLGCVGISFTGREAHGGWPTERPHTSVLAPPLGPLVIILIERFALKKRLQTLRFCKKQNPVKRCSGGGWPTGLIWSFQISRATQGVALRVRWSKYSCRRISAHVLPVVWCWSLKREGLWRKPPCHGRLFWS